MAPLSPRPSSLPSSRPPRFKLDPQRRFALLYALAALSLWWGLTAWWEQRGAVEVVAYSQFEQALREGRVAEVQVLGGVVLGCVVLGAVVRGPVPRRRGDGSSPPGTDPVSAARR